MANTTNYNWETPDDTDLVKDGAAAIRTLGNSIDTTTKNLNPETTLGDISYRSATANTNTRLPIGTAGQVLRVNSGATAPEWATTADQTPLTTKGDLFGFDTADARVPIGTNGQVLIADSAQTLGLKWGVDPTTDVVTTAGDLIYATAADTVTRLGIGTAGQVLKVNSGATAPEWGAAASGKVLQVVSTTVSASRSTTSTSYADVSGASASITPSSASSKILVIANCPGAFASNPSGGGTCYGLINTVRTSTQINEALSGWYISGGSGGQAIGDLYSGVTMITLDEPATTSSTTYKLQHRIPTSGCTFYTSDSSNRKITIILAEIGA